MIFENVDFTRFGEPSISAGEQIGTFLSSARFYAAHPRLPPLHSTILDCTHQTRGWEWYPLHLPHMAIHVSGYSRLLTLLQLTRVKESCTPAQQNAVTVWKMPLIGHQNTPPDLAFLRNNLPLQDFGLMSGVRFGKIAWGFWHWDVVCKMRESDLQKLSTY